MSEQTAVPQVTFDDWARESGRIAIEELRLGNPRAAKDFTDAALAFLALHNALEGDSTPINTDRDAAKAAALDDICEYATCMKKALNPGSFGHDVAVEVLRLAGES